MLVSGGAWPPTAHNFSQIDLRKVSKIQMISRTPSLISDTNRLYRAIGQVVVRFQFVEYIVAEHLAVLLRMRDAEDVHRVSAAMSYRQKVDLMYELYPSRSSPAWPTVDLQAVRRALYVAEEFRNAVVHSFWHVGGTNESGWMRAKSTLRSAAGLKVTLGTVDLNHLELGSEALGVVRDWYVAGSENLQQASATLRSGTQALTQLDCAY